MEVDQLAYVHHAAPTTVPRVFPKVVLAAASAAVAGSYLLPVTYLCRRASLTVCLDKCTANFPSPSCSVQSSALSYQTVTI